MNNFPIGTSIKIRFSATKMKFMTTDLPDVMFVSPIGKSAYDVAMVSKAS